MSPLSLWAPGCSPSEASGRWCQTHCTQPHCVPAPGRGGQRSWMLHGSSSPALVEGREPQWSGEGGAGVFRSVCAGPPCLSRDRDWGWSCCCARNASHARLPPVYGGGKQRGSSLSGSCSLGSGHSGCRAGAVLLASALMCPVCPWPSAVGSLGLDLEAISSELLSWGALGLPSLAPLGCGWDASGT